MMTLLIRFESLLRGVVEFFQDQWFDRTRHVRTSGDVTLSEAGILPGDVLDNEWYVPARPAHIRQALSEIPIRDLSSYSYIDLGSGKGRSLFVAAELPFRNILGIEFSRLLHEQACANIHRFRFWKARCRYIESVNQNALDFIFPDNKMVLYLFNPFGTATMQQVMNKLQESLKCNPRHVVVVLLWPRAGDQVLQIEGMQMIRSVRRHQIFEVHGSANQSGG